MWERNRIVNNLKEKLRVENLIYDIRGKQVMLVVLYVCKNGTKEINQAVKNNIKKSPKDLVGN